VVQQQGVAVGCRLGDLGRAQRAAGAADVLDDHGLVEQVARHLAQHLGQVARHLVGGAAGGERHDDGDGLVGVGGQNMHAWQLHGPFT
jgi:hypothetical protein